MTYRPYVCVKGVTHGFLPDASWAWQVSNVRCSDCQDDMAVIPKRPIKSYTYVPVHLVTDQHGGTLNIKAQRRRSGSNDREVSS